MFGLRMARSLRGVAGMDGKVETYELIVPMLVSASLADPGSVMYDLGVGGAKNPLGESGGVMVAMLQSSGLSFELSCAT